MTLDEWRQQQGLPAVPTGPGQPATAPAPTAPPPAGAPLAVGPPATAAPATAPVSGRNLLNYLPGDVDAYLRGVESTVGMVSPTAAGYSETLRSGLHAGEPSGPIDAYTRGGFTGLGAIGPLAIYPPAAAVAFGGGMLATGLRRWFPNNPELSEYGPAALSLISRPATAVVSGALHGGVLEALFHHLVPGVGTAVGATKAAMKMFADPGMFLRGIPSAAESWLAGKAVTDPGIPTAVPLPNPLAQTAPPVMPPVGPSVIPPAPLAPQTTTFPPLPVAPFPRQVPPTARISPPLGMAQPPGALEDLRNLLLPGVPSVPRTVPAGP